MSKTRISYWTLLGLCNQLKINHDWKTSDTKTFYIHFAAQHSHIDVVKYYIMSTQNILQKKCIKHKAIPLHYASKCWNNIHSQYVLFLILSHENSIHNINEPDIDGKTPLHWAVTRGNLYSIMMLLTYGADQNICDNQGISAVQLAKNLYKTESVEFLIMSGHNSRNYNQY